MTGTNFRALLFALVVAAMLLLAACGGRSQPTPTPTHTPHIDVPPTATAVPAAVATQAPPAELGDPWQRVQSSGALVVGVSADYPPFEYYNQDYQLTGFDVGLMLALAGKLGVQPQFKDIAFEGLGDALAVGQIDLAISAISAVPEREQFVDFSKVYFASDDAYLAAAGSAVEPIYAVVDLARYRVGVQTGSVYADWLEGALVERGLMADTDLFLYPDAEQAVADLEKGLVDIVVLDLPTAQLYAASGGTRIVGEGLNRQRYAIALPKGSPELLAAVNQALTALQDEGVVTQLAQQYLGFDPAAGLPAATPTSQASAASTATAVPTSAPAATATPIVIVPSDCLDGLVWVQDLSYDDQNMTAPPVVGPGQPFRKGWRVRNTGTCTWGNGYALTYAQGNTAASAMGGQTTAVGAAVPPGGTADLYVDMVAPLPFGVYQGVWQMRDALGQPFGERLWVGITVPAGPAPTPAPTQTPSAGISFTANRTSIKADECVAFNWNAQNVREVYFYANGEDWQRNGVAGQGSRNVCPTQTTTYNLRVVKQDGSVETRQTTVNVEQVAGAPSFTRFSVEPDGQIAPNQCVNVRWEVQGNVSQVKVLRNDSTLWDNAPARSNFDDCPPGVGEYTYVVEATGSGGANRASDHVSVVAAATATPAPATPVPGPVILSLQVNPNQIEAGQCTSVAWTTQQTSFIRLYRNGSAVLDGGPDQSSGIQDCPGGAGTVTYELQAMGFDGQTVSQQASLTVAESAATATPAPVAPVISRFSVDRSQIELGECVNLEWEYSGQSLALVQLLRNGEVIGTDMPSPGGVRDCPPQAGSVEYRLQVDAEFGGSTQQSQFVDVADAAAAAQVEPAQITSFVADPPQIDLNNSCTTLSWSFTGAGIAGVGLTRTDASGNTVVLSEADAASPYQDCVDASLVGQALTYELRVAPETGDAATQQVVVMFVGS